jgi:hypothetical protein
MLKKAENKMAYAKVGLYGEAGSGKTYTAAQIAIGLHQFAKLDKPVGMFDTEPAASFIIPYFKKAGIEFLVYDESRALKDLMAFMDEAEAACSVVIIDSITHVWRDTQESYLKRINQTRKDQNKRPLASLEFQHWRPIKSAWADFTDRYLSSKVHCIVCGRAGSVYEYQENDNGKKELITVGTKMATEKEMGYEPSLLIEMIKAFEGGKLVNQAFVEKDRADLLNGKLIDRPDFNKLRSHFEFLNLGGQHFGSMHEKDSTEMFNEEGDDNWTYEKRQREIWGEEIKSLLIEHGLDGSSQEVKQRRVKLLKDVFGTGSWTAIESRQSEKIKEGYLQMKAILGAPVNLDQQDDALNAVASTH